MVPRRGTPDLLIAGASARAAAFSAVRAGLTPACADLFADTDLVSIAECNAVEHWPAGIEHWAASHEPNLPLIYLGGLENEPELLERIGRTRPLYGLTGEPLRGMRSPEALQAILRYADFPSPRISSPAGADPGRRWLVKPRKSAAGRGVRLWNGRPGGVSEDEYLQEFIDGLPGSAAYLAGTGGVELLGTSEAMLPDVSPLRDEFPFAYVGSITTGERTEDLVRLGRVIAATGLRGLFGIDFVRTSTGVVPIEVNPRYTASMELLELLTGRSFIAEHLASYGYGGPPRVARGCARINVRHLGKRIVHAPRSIRVRDLAPPTRHTILSGTYDTADVPVSGAVVPTRAPICTVFASGDTVEECSELLMRREEQVLAACEPVAPVAQLRE